MKNVGIVGNILKKEIAKVIEVMVRNLHKNNIRFMLDETLKSICGEISQLDFKLNFADKDKVASETDLLISIGGDGTMLSTAFLAHSHDKPVVGFNLGKLGFLTEVENENIDSFIDDILKENFTIENRIVLEARLKESEKILYAINDLVIDKGGWPKMIDISLSIDNDFVTTFSADGLIIATPTGSTGYSLSVGGPIVTPNSNVITLSPVAPHSLTMRPLIVPSDSVIEIKVHTPHENVLVNVDGQFVKECSPNLEIKISKSQRMLKVIHMSGRKYFDILRSKLLWGYDVRKNN